MASYANRYPANTFSGLLNVDNSTTGVDSTLRPVQDGAGHALPMEVSTSYINIVSFKYNGNIVSFAGAFAVSGAYACTMTLTGATTVTLPTSGTLLSSATAVTVAQGGTGLQTLTANNVLIGAGTSNVTFVAPGSNGTVLMSNGTTFSSSALDTNAKTCFVTNSSAQADVTGDGTTYTLLFDTATVNDGTMMNLATGTLTAPTTGAWWVGGAIRLGGLAAGHTTCVIAVSGGPTLWSSGAIGSLRNGSNELIIPFNQLTFLTASSTYTITITISGSTKVVDIISSGTQIYFTFLPTA